MIYNNCMYTNLDFWDTLTVAFHKLGHKYFDRSGPLLQIRSQLVNCYFYKQVFLMLLEFSQ